VKCSACSFDNPEPSKFCGGCGRLLTRSCPACGSGNPSHFEFCGQCGTGLIDVPPSPGGTRPVSQIAGSPGAPPTDLRQAERRQVTVLFSDLVGSTAISGRFDPEDLRKLVRTYQTTCVTVIERFAGHVAQFLGDGILAYFGYPTAYEDDAERAVRAGLGILEAVERLGPVPVAGSSIQLAVRVGIATGLVVAGEPMGTHPSEDSGIIGETPNLAARLQALAGPNSVVIAGETHRLLGNRFACEDLGSHELKGFARTVRVWRVIQPNETLSRFQAAQRADLTPLIGREEELEILTRRWEQARTGKGQVVLLAGEPGIGKSRIAQALCERVLSDLGRVLLFQCSPHRTSSALYPVITQLKRLAGFEREDSDAQRLAKIETLLAQSGQSVEASASLLAALLSLRPDNHHAALDVSPRRRRELTLAALQGLIEGLATERGVLLLFEDVHWIDPTSAEWLDIEVQRAADLRVLVVVTFRPTYGPTWTSLPHVTLRVLNRLSPLQATEVVRQVAGGKSLPREVHDQIIAKTDGIPLFIEELTKTVLESGLLQEHADRYTLQGALPPRAIPATLHDSLIARLDQLPSGRQVAQIGSAIGRQFSYELLAAVASMTDQELQATLDDLVKAELVFPHGTPPDVTYVFKHALVQDAAYESLLLARRQVLHARIVEVLETRFPDTAEASPEILAHHCTEARLMDRALHYWLAAGQRASQRSANLEAISHLTRGLDLVSGLPDTPERRRQELQLVLALGPVLINTRGPRTREVAHTYSRALELCSQLPESPQHFAALWGSWRISEHFETKHERAEKLLALAERLGDAGLRLQAHHCLWASLFHLGQHEACREHVDRGLRLYEAGDYRTHGSTYGGHDPKVCGLGERAFALWLLGFPDESLATSREAMAWARRLGHAGSLVHALDMKLLLHRYRRDAQTVRVQAEELIAHSDHHGFSVHEAKGKVFLGWALAELGQTAQGIEYMRQGLEAQKAIGGREDFPILFDMLALTYAAAGQAQLGLDSLDEALAESQRTGLRYWLAELRRSRGEVLMIVSPEHEADAEVEFERALTLAREQQARSLELRAAISMARLAQRRGRAAAAVELLAPIYGWFREGFDTLDLAEAKALLDELTGLAARDRRDQPSRPSRATQD
jgi:class 3 adenylate cyclase/predicted ATPase